MFDNAVAVDIESTWDLWQECRVISYTDGLETIVRQTSVKDETIPLDGKLWVGANICYFDYPILKNLGYTPSALWDVLLVEQILSAGSLRSMPSYKEVVLKYCNVNIDKTEQTSDWSAELTESQLEYCANDVKYLLEIAQRQYTAVLEMGMLTHVILLLELALEWFPDVWEGFPIDDEKRKALVYECQVEATKIKVDLVDRLGVKTFVRSSISKKALDSFNQHIQPYYTSTSLPDTKNVKVADLIDSIDWNIYKDYLISTGDFNEEIFIGPSSPSFSSKIGESYGLDLPSYNAQTLSNFIEDNPDHPVVEIFKLVDKIRKFDKIRSTYARDNAEMYGIRKGELRCKPKFSLTTTGRLTFIPLSTIPRPDEDDDANIRNKLQAMFVPPKGHVTLCTDFGAMESVAAGIFYKDSFKLKSVTEGWDPYLLLASKVFGFDYSDISQTKQLKKEKKLLRQAMKAVELARNFGAGVGKINQMMADICAKYEITPVVTGKQVIDAWNELYPDLAFAMEFIKEDTIQVYQDRVPSYKPFQKPIAANIKNRFKEINLITSASNVFGLQVINPAHSFCEWIRTPILINHPIQSSCLRGSTKIKPVSPNGILDSKQEETIESLYERWSQGRETRNSSPKEIAYLRKRIQRKRLEVLNTSTLKREFGNIKNVMLMGEKQIYKYTLESGKVLECTADHRVFDKVKGWVQIQDAKEIAVFSRGNSIKHKAYSALPLNDEYWVKLVSREGYEISNYGRLRSYCIGNSSKLKETPTIKYSQISSDGRYLVYGVGRKPKRLHTLMAEAFLGPKHPNTEVTHLDGDSFNNHISNLAYRTSKDNSQDIKDLYGNYGTERLCNFEKIVNYEDLGIEKVYDIEMDHPEHNFTVNDGIVVHNCAVVTYLAILFVKKAFPSLRIACSIHDSLVIFVPETGLQRPDGTILTLPDIEKSVVHLMQLAFYTVFGNPIKVDSGYSNNGLKG
jgi:hypothetical protein